MLLPVELKILAGQEEEWLDAGHLEVVQWQKLDADKRNGFWVL